MKSAEPVPGPCGCQMHKRAVVVACEGSAVTAALRIRICRALTQCGNPILQLRNPLQRSPDIRRGNLAGFWRGPAGPVVQSTIQSNNNMLWRCVLRLVEGPGRSNGPAPIPPAPARIRWTNFSVRNSPSTRCLTSRKGFAICARTARLYGPRSLTSLRELRLTPRKRSVARNQVSDGAR